MNRYIIYALSVLLSVISFCSCDEHDPLDLDIHSSYILLSDGRIIDSQEFDKSVHTPVAVVFAEQTETHPVLAVMLDELPSVQFSEILGFDQKTSGSLTDFDGYVNTVALQTTTVTVDSIERGSPLGRSAFYNHYFSQSDYVPSVREMELLYKELYRVNPVISMCGGTPVSTTPDGAGCWYWTSTEVAENKPNQAWLFSMADGSHHRTPKTNHYRARLIVEYNPWKE